MCVFKKSNLANNNSVLVLYWSRDLRVSMAIFWRLKVGMCRHAQLVRLLQEIVESLFFPPPLQFWKSCLVWNDGQRSLETLSFFNNRQGGREDFCFIMSKIGCHCDSKLIVHSLPDVESKSKSVQRWLSWTAVAFTRSYYVELNWSMCTYVCIGAKQALLRTADRACTWWRRRRRRRRTVAFG